jgi:UDP-2,3-diacylglucosamine hydrolase
MSPSLATPPAARLAAPAHWRRVDFISDLHLDPREPQTVQAFHRYLATAGADALFILGDLFEVWIGDDAASPGSLEHDCAQWLHAASQHAPVFFMHGNRDFLLGEAFARQAGMTLLSDPTVLDFGGLAWLLSHGDALCVGDTDYMVFRERVRAPAWQADFLAQPLEQRRAFARSAREQSEARKREPGTVYADADVMLSQQWLDDARARTLIHGHTHRPAEHTLPGGARRIVLSDWDLSATPPRAEVLRLDVHGVTRRLSLAAT